MPEHRRDKPLPAASRIHGRASPRIAKKKGRRVVIPAAKVGVLSPFGDDTLKEVVNKVRKAACLYASSEYAERSAETSLPLAHYSAQTPLSTRIVAAGPAAEGPSGTARPPAA